MAISLDGSHAAGPIIGPLPGVSAAGAPLPEGSLVKFRLLADKTSNSCGLQPSVVMGMSDRLRLQGSCCSPMDRTSYVAQVRGLHSFRDIAQIPRDPYDIPVALVKRLLAYDRSIRLDPGQQRTYMRAMQMSPEKGPCCCHCWRWSAFEGLGKYLIAQRAWPAARLGRLIGLLDGCGGPGHG